MKILALERELPGATASAFSANAKAEAAKAWELMQSEKIREIYFRADQDCAVIVLECRDRTEAAEILKQLPFVKNGLIEFELIPLKPYPGFERLFC